jgi:fructosamine-3-kinase
VKPAFLEAALQRALADASLRVTEARPVGGGCIHEAVRLVTGKGEFFAKWNADAPPDLFPSEARGLDALRDAAGPGLAVPRVIAVSEPERGAPGVLILEFLAPGTADARAGERLGRGLAAIHRASAARFGFPCATYCGATRQENATSDTWADFYATRRLRPLLQALDLSGDERRVFDRLIERLPEILPSAAAPSLIHGDLWAGNVLSTLRGPALVDPSCAYADREMEFGITTLFGGLPPRAWAAYEEAWPLAPGWRDRNAVYQCYHLLNHALLFGGGYLAQARSAARRFVGTA